MLKFYDLSNKEIPFFELKERFSSELHLLSSFEGEASFVVEGERLKLLHPFGNPIFIDVEKELFYHKNFFKKHSQKKEPLKRALGLKEGVRVFDVSGGLLGDSLLICALGGIVSVFERNPLIQALITNALRIYTPDHFSFSPLDAAQILDFSSCDVIFFDPMYQEVNKKSLPRKEMQAFREIVGSDLDARSVFLTLKASKKRLVVKRGVRSESFSKPSFCVLGKSTAYDVYF